MSVNKPAPRPVNPNKSIKHAAAQRRGSVILNKFHSYPWRRGRNITRLRLHRLIAPQTAKAVPAASCGANHSIN